MKSVFAVEFCEISKIDEILNFAVLKYNILFSLPQSKAKVTSYNLQTYIM